MLDPTRPLEPITTGRVLDAQGSFGRTRADAGTFLGMVARSTAMVHLAHLVERLAPVARGALIEGDVGTGKSMLVAGVHRLGPCRSVPPLVLTFDDPAVIIRLHESAAGARAPLVGVLPELADVSPALQAALVAALRTGESLPLGVGLHVIAATAFDPNLLRADRRLRDDLYFQLTMARFRMPALAERAADLPELVAALVREVCRSRGGEPMAVAAAAIDVLAARSWPGQVRELRNVIARAVALNDSGVIGAPTIRLACALDPEPAPAVRRQAPEARPLDVDARQRVTAALSATGGNKSEAAERLGVSRRALYRLLERLDA
jgi:two-component system, NtrC family, response regulator AtoC